jgi:hypothetical protein
LVAGVIELPPLLREHAAPMDAQRQLSDGVNTALVDAGIAGSDTPAMTRRDRGRPPGE